MFYGPIVQLMAYNEHITMTSTNVKTYFNKLHNILCELSVPFCRRIFPNFYYCFQGFDEDSQVSKMSLEYIPRSGVIGDINILKLLMSDSQ